MSKKGTRRRQRLCAPDNHVPADRQGFVTDVRVRQVAESGFPRVSYESVCALLGKVPTGNGGTR
jgi:hypothetical protein